jgi:ATP-dependent protease ClpP protease subunit
MPKAKLIIDKNIGENDEWAELWGMADPCFSARDCRNFLNENAEADEIEIEISSNGGNTTHGFEIYDLLKLSGKKITTTAYKCNSIATVIFLAGEDRRISKNAQFVIHNPFVDPWGLGYDGLTADDLQKIADEVKSVEDKIFNLYIEALALDETKQAEIKNLMSADTDLGADRALEFGFATAIINGPSQAKAIKMAQYSSNIAAFLKTKSKKSDMDIKAFKTQLDAISASITKGFEKLGLKPDGTPTKPEVKNATATLEDGGTIYFAEDSLTNGITIYTDEAMTTVASAGDYRLQDGTTFKVDDAGKTSEVTEPANLQAENARLTEEVSNLQTELQNANQAKVEVVNQLKDLSKQVSDLLKVVPGDSGKPTPEGPKGEISAAKTDLEKRRRFRA